MKKLIVLLIALSLVGVFAMADDFSQDLDGQPVTIEVNDLDFGNIFGSGPTEGQGTVFTVTPQEAIAELGLFVDGIAATVTGGTATIEYSEDGANGWAALSPTPTDTNIALDDTDPADPTLWIRLNGLSGSAAIEGTVTYTIMSGFEA